MRTVEIVTSLEGRERVEAFPAQRLKTHTEGIKENAAGGKKRNEEVLLSRGKESTDIWKIWGGGLSENASLRHGREVPVDSLYGHGS